MKFFSLLFLVFFCLNAWSYDCQHASTFQPSGQQTVRVTVARFSWKQGVPSDEEVCKRSLEINWFDIRNREEEAYYCLKPEPNEVVTCDTELEGESAQITVVPASWIRNFDSNSNREYHFHAYALKNQNPDFYFDLFSRSILSDLDSKPVAIEGALKTGPGNPADSFWVRVEFLGGNP